MLSKQCRLQLRLERYDLVVPLFEEAIGLTGEMVVSCGELIDLLGKLENLRLRKRELSLECDQCLLHRRRHCECAVGVALPVGAK